MNNNQIETKKTCYFCENGIKEVDYKDIRTLRNFINTYKKIFPRKKTGLCSKHQRKLALAIKNARVMALLPYIR
ncbi:30S ribosomal protein S18 [Candidatus Parcubacteria bacterium]|nr:30S ribosomal protein S18 [Candidatus Parcubacteria bacterium]